MTQDSEHKNQTEKLPVGDAFRFAWEGVRENFILLVGIAFFLGTILAGATLLIGFLSTRNQGLSSLFALCLQLAANSILPSGGIALCLKVCDRKRPQLEDLLCPMKTILFYYIGSLIYGSFIFVGLLFLVVPGVYFAIRFCLMGYFVVDLGLDPIEAIKRSWEATEGQVLNLLVFGLTMMLVNLAAFRALFVGLFLTMPLTMVAAAYIYRVLGNRVNRQIMTNAK